MALTLLLLYLLATLDTAFCGYRAAAGRSGLIFKGGYYRRAMRRGALWGQLAVAVAAAAGLLLVALSPAPKRLLADFTEAGDRLLEVYLPYAGVIGLAFAVRAVPSVDVRSLTSVLVFGPFTLARPVVVPAGAAWALFHVPRPGVMVMLAIIIPTMLLAEPWLDRRPNVGVPNGW
jgi:hypothetical protein